MATLEQIQARIEKLRVQEAVLRQKQHGKLIKDIHAMMEQNGLTVEDLQAAATNGANEVPAGRPSRLLMAPYL